MWWEHHDAQEIQLRLWVTGGFDFDMVCAKPSLSPWLLRDISQSPVVLPRWSCEVKRRRDGRVRKILKCRIQIFGQLTLWIVLKFGLLFQVVQHSLPSFFAIKLDEIEGSWLENGTGPLTQVFCSTHLFPSSIVLWYRTVTWYVVHSQASPR